MLDVYDNLLYATCGTWDLERILPAFLPQWRGHIGKISKASCVDDVLKRIPWIKRRAIIMRYGLDRGSMRTFKEAGEVVNVSAPYIHAEVSICLSMLRHPSRRRKLYKYFPEPLSIRLAFARTELYEKLVNIYPPTVALTVAGRIKKEDMREALKTTEAALKASCGITISKCLYCDIPLPPRWNFCNTNCQSKYNMVLVVCDTCGRTFKRPAKLLLGRTHSYCSRYCRDNYMREICLRVARHFTGIFTLPMFMQLSGRNYTSSSFLLWKYSRGENALLGKRALIHRSSISLPKREYWVNMEALQTPGPKKAGE